MLMALNRAFRSQQCGIFRVVHVVTAAIGILVTVNAGQAGIIGDTVTFRGDWVGTDSATGIAGTDDLTIVLTSALSVTPSFTDDTITLTMTGSANPGNYIPRLDSLSVSGLDWNGDGIIFGATATENIADPRLISVDVNYTDTSVSIAPLPGDDQFSWFPGETIVIEIESRHIPEPTTTALAGLGLLGMSMCTRRLV